MEWESKEPGVWLAIWKSPHLDDEGRPNVPPLTAFILDRFARDDKVFQEFFAANLSMRSHGGDFPASLDNDVEIARHFLGHPLKRVAEWARDKIDHGRKESAFWRQQEEEMVHH